MLLIHFDALHIITVSYIIIILRLFANERTNSQSRKPY